MKTEDIDNIVMSKMNTVFNFLKQEGFGLFIPNFQREYRWSEDSVTHLISDLFLKFSEYIDDQMTIKYIGSIILHLNYYDKNENRSKLYTRVDAVIDGQQRLITFLILLFVLYDILEEILKTTNDNIKINKLFDEIKKACWVNDNELPKMYAEADSLDNTNMHSKISYLWNNRKTTNNNNIINRNYNIIKTMIFEEFMNNVNNISYNNLLSDSRYKYNDIKIDKNNVIDIKIIYYFSMFLLENVTFTEVSVKKEDIIFDIFESLNTSGEPLNAFDTFKPKVISYSNDYKSICRTFKLIDDYLDNCSSDKKQKNLSYFIIPFSLSYSGYKMSFHMRDQSKYLFKTFEKAEKKDFLNKLDKCLEFYLETWLKKKTLESNEATLLLKVLVDSGHKLSLSLYFIFLMRNLINDDYIKAYVAFILYWRLCSSGTSQIDEEIRKIFYITNKESLAYINKNIEIISIDKFKTILCRSIRKNIIKNKEDFIFKAKGNQIYSNKALAKFTILISNHNTTIHNDGELIRDSRGAELNIKYFDYTLEHIAPQKKNGFWTKEIYDNIIPNTIGNLTLLPSSINSVLGNSEWKKKSEIYELLSEDKLEDFQTKIKQINNSKPINKNKLKLLENSDYINVLKSLPRYGDTWGVLEIEKRTKNLLSLTYDFLKNWLDIENDN